MPLFQSNLLLALTKNLKFCYVNVDSLIWDNNFERHKMKTYDKIYGQQSFIVCSKLIQANDAATQCL